MKIFNIKNEWDIGSVRKYIAKESKEMGVSETEVSQISIAVAELCTNLIKHHVIEGKITFKKVEEYLIKRNIELEEQNRNLTEELNETNHEVLILLEEFEKANNDMLINDREKNIFLEKLKVTNKEQLERIKAQENALIQAEKLVSLGRLIAGIAHEINNPNTYMRSNIELLQKYWKFIQKNIDAIREDNVKNIIEDFPIVLASIYKGTERIMEIVSGLKYFSRQEKVKFVKFDLNDCVEEAYKLVKSEFIKNKITFINKMCSDLYEIQGSKQQIEQVIINLFLNSIKAIEANLKDNGEIKIEAHIGNDFLTLSIKDNGCGIKEEEIAMIFNPFFTTYQRNGGTGLGLSIVYGIVREHGGTIRVSSKVNEGTEFFVTFPNIKLDEGDQNE